MTTSKVIGSAHPPSYPPLTWRERALDLIFPPTCVHCRTVGRWVCAECWPLMPWRLEQRCSSCHRLWIDDPCAHCAGHGSALDSLTGAFEFDAAARECVHALKYLGRHGISGTMSRSMAQAVTGFPVDYVAAVSLHPTRRRERGYDQSDMLARGVARALDVPYDGGLVKRVRRTRQQVTLSRDARLRNVMGAFEATGELDGETILLIDDVITTGATMGAAARALKAAGAGRVQGLAFACAALGRDGMDDGVADTIQQS